MVIDGGATGSLGNMPFPYPNLLERDDDNGTGPKAYLNWLVFDRDFKYLDGGFKRLSEGAKESGHNTAHEELSYELAVKEPGYVYIYLSNESDSEVEVYFDDFSVEHMKSKVIQTQDYYPFGLTYNSFSRENSIKQSYLYNAKELQDELDLNWHDYGARMYDATLSRFSKLDPFCEKYHIWTPYGYAINNPIRYIDYNGLGPGDGITGVEIVKAFDDGKIGVTYQMTLYVDQPGIGGDRDTYEPKDPRAIFGRDAGHTFLSLKKTNEDGSVTEKTFGWYPGTKEDHGGVDIRDGNAKDRRGNKTGSFQDDSEHKYDVSKTYNLSQENFINLLVEVVRKDGETFNLNTNNCTDVALKILQQAGIKINATKGKWEFYGFSVGGGNNPGDLGEDLRKDPATNQEPGKAKTNEEKSSSGD